MHDIDNLNHFMQRYLPRLGGIIKQLNVLGVFLTKNFTTGSRRFHRCRLPLLLLGSHAAGLLNPPFNKGSLTRLVAIVSMTAVNFMYPQAGEG